MKILLKKKQIFINFSEKSKMDKKEIINILLNLKLLN